MNYSELVKPRWWWCSKCVK